MFFELHVRNYHTSFHAFLPKGKAIIKTLDKKYEIIIENKVETFEQSNAQS